MLLPLVLHLPFLRRDLRNLKIQLVKRERLPRRRAMLHFSGEQPMGDSDTKRTKWKTLVSDVCGDLPLAPKTKNTLRKMALGANNQANLDGLEDLKDMMETRM